MKRLALLLLLALGAGPAFAQFTPKVMLMGVWIASSSVEEHKCLDLDKLEIVQQVEGTLDGRKVLAAVVKVPRVPKCRSKQRWPDTTTAVMAYETQEGGSTQPLLIALGHDMRIQSLAGGALTFTQSPYAAGDERGAHAALRTRRFKLQGNQLVEE